MGPSSADAIGWMQFMPAPWLSYGMDTDGDGRASSQARWTPSSRPRRYLRASGAAGITYRALYHADWYVRLVLR